MPASTNLPPIITPGGNVAPTQQPYPPAVQPYIDNGLTYQSNNADFVERDDNGNIIINQGSEDNQNLVLEAMSLFYVNRSVVRNIDTRFKYFKFPAENIAVPDISFEGFGIDDLADPLYAKYRPSEPYTVSNRGSDRNKYSGILMDEVIQGLPQQYRNRYEITPEIKELAVDGLRMRIRLEHIYNSYGIDLANSRWSPEDGTVKALHSQLSPWIRNNIITEADWNTFEGSALVIYNRFVFNNEGDLDAADADFKEQLNEWNFQTENTETFLEEAKNRYIRIFFNERDLTPDPETNQPRNTLIAGAYGTIYFSIIKRDYETGNLIRDYRELSVEAGENGVITATGPEISEYDIPAREPKISEYDIIIPPDLFDVGELFGIGAIVGQRPGIEQPRRFIRPQHTILSAGTQWSITDASKNVDENNVEIETP